MGTCASKPPVVLINPEEEYPALVAAAQHLDLPHVEVIPDPEQHIRHIYQSLLHRGVEQGEHNDDVRAWMIRANHYLSSLRTVPRYQTKIVIL